MGIIRSRDTGHSRRLLAPLLKYIDYINSVFGPLEEQKAG